MGLAIANAAFREGVFSPRWGEAAGHIASTITLCLVILGVAGLTIRWIGPGTGWAAFLVGLLWLILTTAFEFLAGHYLFGNSWGRLLADYDVTRGRVWILVLLTTLVAPVAAARLRGLGSTAP